jgi:RNA polymerase sigma-70 factor (ECF subfamily)
MTAYEFDTLVVNGSSFLRPYAISLTRDSEDAKDLYQETLLRALANRDKYQWGTNLKAWLCTIMRNVFINQYRRSKRFGKTLGETPTEVYQYEQGMAARNDGWSGLRMAEVRSAVDALPGVFRISFELYTVGYKYQEIADLLKEPLGTIKSRIHFARKTLTNKLER